MRLAPGSVNHPPAVRPRPKVIWMGRLAGSAPDTAIRLRSELSGRRAVLPLAYQRPPESATRPTNGRARAFMTSAVRVLRHSSRLADRSLILRRRMTTTLIAKTAPSARHARSMRFRQRSVNGRLRPGAARHRPHLLPFEAQP